jgi:HlyD family secretion protein
LKSAYHAAVKAQTTGKIEAKSVYQQSKLSQKNAKTTYQATVSSLNADVKEARETYTQAQEAKEEFETFVKGRVVRAEYSGTLSALGYQEGDSLSSATDIATYLDADAVTITVSVSEEDVANIQVGNAVNIYLSAYEDELFEGEVQSISSTATGDSTVSYPVVVTVTSDVSKIYSGMTSEVTFVSKEVENVLYVSNKAITTEGTNSYVLLKKEDGTTQKTKVTTGFSDGHNVEIQSGLEEGDIVLIESKVSQ